MATIVRVGYILLNRVKLCGKISSTKLNLSNSFAPHLSLPCVRGGGTAKP